MRYRLTLSVGGVETGWAEFDGDLLMPLQPVYIRLLPAFEQESFATEPVIVKIEEA